MSINKPGEFDFDPALDTNAYYQGLENFLYGKNHYKTDRPYTHMLQEFLFRVSYNTKWTHEDKKSAAVKKIKYYVALYKKQNGNMSQFWNKLVPEKIENTEWQVIKRPKNRHFPDYLKFMKNSRTLITKIVTSAYAVEKTQQQLAETLSAPELQEIVETPIERRTIGSHAHIHSTFESGAPLDWIVSSNAAYVVADGEIYNPEDAKELFWKNF